MKKTWLKIIGTTLVGLMALTGCGSSSDDSSQAEQTDDQEAQQEETTTYKIGVSQFVEHPSLDAAYEGFKKAIEDAGLNVEYDFHSAAADQNNVAPIANTLVSNNVDLIFANATPSAQGAAQATSDIPIVFTSVTDPVGAGLVPSMEEAGGNVTGVVDLHPDAIENTVNFIDKYFEGATVGIIYNPGEANSVTQMEKIEEVAEGTSLKIETRSVSTTSEVKQAAESLVGVADVFYIFTDNTVVTSLEAVVSTANEQDIPLVVGEPDSLKRGGFVTYGIDYFTIGYRAGEMAVQILTGEKSVSEIAPEYPEEMQLFINKGAAELQAVEWVDEWDEIAQFIDTEESEENGEEEEE